MKMLNKVILIGRLTKNPEIRYTPSGTAVGGFTLAVDRPFTNQKGEKDTDFIDIVTWQKLAETCSNNLQKGRLVAVEGRLQIRAYEDKKGIRRKAAEVIAENIRFPDWPKDNKNTQNQNKSYSNNNAKSFEYSDMDGTVLN